MNTINLIGHVAVDVKIGNGVASTLLAVHRIYHSHDGQDTDFIPLSIFGKQAENFSKMVEKGQLIGIDGSIKTSTYADPVTGEKKYGWSAVVSHFYLLNGSSHEGQHQQEKLSQQTVSNSMQSSAQNPQQQLYDQYHQQTAQTPQPAIDKQIDDLDSQLEKAKPADKQAYGEESISPIPSLGNNKNNRSHVSGNDFSQAVINNQPTVEELQQEIKDLKAKAMPF